MRISLRRVGRARFNAPDLKSDVRSNVPEVRILYSPPYYEKARLVKRAFFMPVITVFADFGKRLREGSI